MEGCAMTGIHDFNMASRKAEEAAWRRFLAVEWLENLVGPLGMSNQPSEREFISCLRSGLILCNAINKIEPGAVPKVVENHLPLQSLSRESQPLPAYQYFENVRNFLVAVEKLNVPAFEASDLERDTMDVGSAAKVVDCILALKSYYQWKQFSGGNGCYKYVKSPMVLHSASRMHPRGISSLDSCRRIDMSAACEKQPFLDGETQNLEDLVVKALADLMVSSKENIDNNLLSSFQSRNMDPVMLFSKLISSCMEKPAEKIVPELKPISKDPLRERDSPHEDSTIMAEELFAAENSKCCRVCFQIGDCIHKNLILMQEKELLDLKALLSKTKTEITDFQSQLRTDMRQLEKQVAELSSAAYGYHKVLKENQDLYNMVQDLKGNIRVYCRIRPAFSPEAASVINFYGEDGSLVILDPSKPNKDGKKVFQFNRVFGPMATQDDVFKDTQPLIRSVMDGYNVCIFAYGQTGSGKTHTMSGPSGVSNKDMGINYLALNDLFRISHIRRNVIHYDIYVQMVEIYNEQVRDLLAEDLSNNKLGIRSCTSDNGLSTPNATMHSVKSTSDVLNLMRHGEVNRVVSSTAMNNRSSRSHSILTVHVRGKDTSGGTLRSCLHLVDLAGSERVDKSEVTGDRLKEAQHINKSLSCLGDVIMALGQKNSHVPYRNSKLTLLLQDSLGGNAKTLMFAHVSPDVDSFGETISTLKFAQRASTVELGSARLNKESLEVMKLKEQVEILKKALANKEVQNTESIRTELRSPHKKLKAAAEDDTPCSRRMSIEDCSAVKNVKPINTEDKRGLKTPSLPTRSRRLSLEGRRYPMSENLQTRMPDTIPKPPPFGLVSPQKCNQFQGSEEVSKPSRDFSNATFAPEAYNSSPYQSPTGSAYQKRLLRTDGRTSIPKLQLPKSPEPSIMARNAVQTVMQSDFTLSADSQTPKVNSTNGKGSQIRKSLRTIGKLINGSDRRNQQNMVEPRTPNNGIGYTNDGRSPLTATAKTMRRRSLTGVQASGLERSRRSSLGGKPEESNGDAARNAKTPPPLRSSTKITKRWL